MARSSAPPSVAAPGQLIALGAGTLLGALLGTEVGKSLDKADRLYASRTTHQTLEYAPTGITGQWHNPESGNTGSVTPLATNITANGQPCREYHQSITIGGNTETYSHITYDIQRKSTHGQPK